MSEEPGKLDETLNAKPYEPPKPRPLRRTLVIVGLSGLGAVLIAAIGHRTLCARWENRTVGNSRAFVRAQADLYKFSGNDSNGLRRYAVQIWGMGHFIESDQGGGPRFVCPIPGSYDPVPRVTPPGFSKDGYSFREMTSIGGQDIDWTKDFVFCAKPTRYWWSGRRVFIVKTDGVVWAKDLGKSDFVVDFPADPSKEGWQVAE